MQIFYCLALFSLDNAFKCYKCTSDDSQECWKVDYKDSFQKVLCTKKACLTVKLPTKGGIQRLTRDCYKEEYCDKYSICKRCEEPLCNSSEYSRFTAIYLLMSLAVLTIYLWAMECVPLATRVV